MRALNQSEDSNMHILIRTHWRRDEETHRFFPEWADRVERSGVQPESDRNSYSAGGYAEEFGYRAQPGLPTPAPLLSGDPEGRKIWRTQRGALHPGYPECPRPLDRDGAIFSAVPLCSGVVSDRDTLLGAYTMDARVIRLGRPQSFGSGSWAQVVSLWRVFRVCARHLDGF
jgi:hypothetical protein